jgi:hypothetical protein
VRKPGPRHTRRVRDLAGAWEYGGAVPASSLIFLVIVVLWAAYLVPGAIRKHRRTASARQADRDSQAMRVVVRRGSAPVGSALAAAAANAASAHTAVAGSSSRPVLGPGPRALTGSAPVPARPASPAPVRATSAVVRRRRRLLASVAALTVLGWSLVAAGAAPLVTGVLPTLGLVLVVAVLSRHGASRPARPVVAPVRVTEARPTPRVVRPAAPTVPAAVPAPREERTSPLAGDRGWQPVPVPLPTYLLKDKAPRAVPPLPAVAVVPGLDEDDVPTRVIDLREHARVVNQ